MDTRTGEIFREDDIEHLRTNRRRLEREESARLERYERGLADGHVVPVSEQVARHQMLGQSVDAERKRKRKAANAARKQNRKR